MSLPVTPPYVFGNVTSSIPLTNLDADFATIYAAVNGIGNGTVALANVSITGGSIQNVSVTLDTINNTPIGNTTPSTGAFTSLTDTGLTSGRVTYATTGGLLTDSANLTFNGTTLTVANDASISGLTVGKGGGSVARNTALGLNALLLNTSGNLNTAIGQSALYTNTTGANNTATGDFSLVYNTTGSSNTALGQAALQSNTTASYNTAVGYQAGYSGATGNKNTLLGAFTGYATTAGGADTFNTFVGYASGYTQTSGTYNTYVGPAAGYQMTTGAKNTIIGGFTGNQGGLDIRTASNYIVLSDGDGNPRVSIPTGTATATIPNATGTVMVSGNMPAFNAYVGTSYNLAYNVTTKVPFDTKVFDTNTNFSTTNNRFTPTVAGYYLINTFLGISGSGGGQTGSLGLVLNLYKNGTNFSQLGNVIGVSSFPGLNCSILVYANGTTDYFEIWAYSNAGNPSGVPIQNGQTYSSFSATLVRSA